MARRVKKTDDREIDHWVSTDDGRHLPIDKDGNIIFGSSKKSTSKSGSKYKKNLNGTYQRQEKRDGTLVQATIIPGRDKGKDFYTIKTGIGDDFESSDERYSTLSSAKNAADKALENRLNSKENTSKSDSSKKKETSKKSKVEFKEFKPEPWMDEEEMAEALVDSKDYIGDRALYQGVKDDLKSSGYSMGTKLTVDHAELVEYDGKGRYGTVEATYTIRDNGDFYGKKGTEYTERFQVPVVKDYSDSTSKSKSSSPEKSKSASPAKELTREQKVLNDDKVQNLLNTAKSSWGEGVFKDPDGEKFEIGYETDKYYNIYQTSDGQRFDESRVQRMVEGIDSGKYHAWNNQGKLLVTSSAKAAVKHAWGTPKEAGLKRETPKESAKKTTASSKTNKIRQLMGNDKNMVEWKINRAYDKTSLKELALDAGVPSSKVRTMSTEELRAMLLSMWKGK